MSLRNAKPLVWSPQGAMDTLDASTALTGAMASLQNLIPDPSTKNLWQCRPAARLLIDLADHGFTAPDFIACTLVIGTRLYGMVSTSRNPGQDEPFCYDIATNVIVPITGVTAGNTPISPQTSGPWNPPVMTLVGTKIIVAHPGFTGVGDLFFGVIETLNPNALTWTAQNVVPNPLTTPPNPGVVLPCPPQWVAKFNNRCFYFCNPSGGQPVAIFSDVLNATQTTNSAASGLNTPVLTFDDNVPLTCAIGLSLFNQLGGIIQSLMVFKGVENIYQITGDPTTNNLAVNSLNVATGTLSPAAVALTTKGIAFLAPDGVRMIDFTAKVSDPIGRNGDGITIPFYNSLSPSRAVGAFSNGVLRNQIQNGAATGSPQQEWWCDFVRDNIWSGPHTTNVSTIAPYLNSFLLTIQGAGGKIFQSDPVQTSTSSFNENGKDLTYNFQTAFLPDTDAMAENCIVESTTYAALVTQSNIVITALNEAGKLLDTVLISTGGQSTLWGSFTWGQAPWQGQVSPLAPRLHRWTKPLVFRRLTLAHAGMSAIGVKLGRMHLRYQMLGYVQEDQGTRMALVLGIGQFTLNPNTTQTVVVAPCTTSTAVFISPLTPDAANDMATTSIVPGNGAFTVTHANNPRTDRTFAYEVVG